MKSNTIQYNTILKYERNFITYGLVVGEQKFEHERASNRVQSWDDDVGEHHIRMDHEFGQICHPVLPLNLQSCKNTKLKPQAKR